MSLGLGWGLKSPDHKKAALFLGPSPGLGMSSDLSLDISPWTPALSQTLDCMQGTQINKMCINEIQEMF